MRRKKLTAALIGAGEWPDSRRDQRAYWLSRPAKERVAAGRDLHRRVCAWFHLKGPSLAEARRSVRPHP